MTGLVLWTPLAFRQISMTVSWRKKSDVSLFTFPCTCHSCSRSNFRVSFPKLPLSDNSSKHILNKSFIVLLLDLFVTFKRCRMSCQDIFLYTIHTETALLKRNSCCCLIHYGDQASPAPCKCASAAVWKISPSHPNKQIKLVHLINTMSYMLPRAVGLISLDVQ